MYSWHKQLLYLFPSLLMIILKDKLSISNTTVRLLLQARAWHLQHAHKTWCIRSSHNHPNKQSSTQFSPVMSRHFTHKDTSQTDWHSETLWLVAAADEMKRKQRELSPEPSTQSHTPPAVSCCKRVQWKYARHKGPQSKIPLSDNPSPCTPYCFQKVRTQGKQEASRVQMVCSEHLFSLKRALLPALLTLNRWTTPKIRQ